MQMHYTPEDNIQLTMTLDEYATIKTALMIARGTDLGADMNAHIITTAAALHEASREARSL